MRADELNGSVERQPQVRSEYRAFVTRNFGSFSVEIERHRQFSITGSSFVADGFMLARAKTVSGRTKFSRSASDIKRDLLERYVLYFPLVGRHEIGHRRQVVTCDATSIAFACWYEPIVQTKLDPTHDSIYFVMPREFVDQRIVGSYESCPSVTAANQGVWQLARESLLALHSHAASMSLEKFAASSKIVTELILLAFGGLNDVRSESSPVRVSNLARAKRIVARRLVDPTLTLTALAGECGISLRYLHDLFREENLSVERYIKVQRLNRARQLLATADVNTYSVGRAAAECGFGNLSHFSTAFKTEFGVSPREVFHTKRLMRDLARA